MNLARVQQPDESIPAFPSRLKLVSQPVPETVRPVVSPTPERPTGFAIVQRTLARVRDAVEQQPDRYRKLGDRLLVFSILVVLAVAAYALIAAPD